MSKFTEYIGSQFANPRGILGKCCCLLMNAINKVMYSSVVTRVELNEQSKLLDIGYGNGYLIRKVYQKYKADIYGIDISEDMKDVAIKRNREAVKAGKIKLTVGDCCRLPYQDNIFEAVSSVNTVYFWSDTLTGLTEIYRVLTIGGSFYNAVYSKEWMNKLSYTKKGFKLFDKEELTSLGERAGFSEVSVKDITKGKSYLVQYKK